MCVSCLLYFKIKEIYSVTTSTHIFIRVTRVCACVHACMCVLIFIFLLRINYNACDIFPEVLNLVWYNLLTKCSEQLVKCFKFRNGDIITRPSQRYYIPTVFLFRKESSLGFGSVNKCQLNISKNGVVRLIFRSCELLLQQILCFPENYWMFCNYFSLY